MISRRLAQLVRASGLHPEGRGFESAAPLRRCRFVAARLECAMDQTSRIKWIAAGGILVATFAIAAMATTRLGKMVDVFQVRRELSFV